MIHLSGFRDGNAGKDRGAGFTGCKGRGSQHQFLGFAIPTTGSAGTALQFLLQRDVRPGDKPFIDIQERLDGACALVDFHHAFFVEQGLRHILAGAYRRPVGLSSQQIFRVKPWGLFFGDGLKKSVDGAGKIVGPDLDADDAETLALPALAQVEPDIARDGLR